MADRGQSSGPLVRLLAGRWTLTVLAALADGGCRYRELHDALEGISHKVLVRPAARGRHDCKGAIMT